MQRKKLSNITLRKHGIKRCLDCGEIKLLEEFPKGGISSTGLQQYRPVCFECSRKEPARFSPCWSCADLEACKHVLFKLVDVGDHYEPHPLPCYEMEKV